MNMPAPKLFRRSPDESNWWTGGKVEPAQLSYWNGEAPGGMSGFAPHRSATQTDSPSLSIATPVQSSPLPSLGKFSPRRDGLVRIGQIVGRLDISDGLVRHGGGASAEQCDR